MRLTELPAEKPITLICHHDNVSITNDKPNSVIVIGPEATLNMARRIDAEPGTWAMLKASKVFMELLRCVFTEQQLPTLPDHPLHMHGTGLQHTVGLIVLLRDALMNGKQPFVSHPECYLHPAHAAGLADLFVKLQNLNIKPEKQS